METDPRVEPIAEAMAMHYGYRGVGSECSCGASFTDGWVGYRRHVAAEAVAALDRMQAEALPAADAPTMAPMHSAPTSQAMREAALPRSGSLRATVVQLLLNHGHTDDELERTLARSHQSVSAARYTLVQQGWVQPMTHDGVPVTRPTRAGNAAQVWTLTPPARLRLAIGR